MTHSATWADFYLICFAVGFCFSFFSFLFGGVPGGHLHAPHFHVHGASHLPSAHASPGHGPAAAGMQRSAGPSSSGSAPSTGHSGDVSIFNFVTLTAFLAWFGGTGYLLTRYSGLWVGFGLLLSIMSGLAGGGAVFLFLTKVLISHQESMDPADYEMTGVLGRVSVPIRAGGTGEIIYSQVGTRRVCGARSEHNNAIAKGTEVVVTRYDKGIAYVRLWSEMSGEQ
jgi:membrane protein implicated in regulation of membrane protease activity